MEQFKGAAAAPVQRPDGTPAGRVPEEFAFLRGRHADRQTLDRAARLARRWRVSPEQALMTAGFVAPPAYYRALAANTGLPFRRLPPGALDMRMARHPRGRVMMDAGIVPLNEPGEPGLQVAMAPRERALRRLVALARRPDAARLLGRHVRITTPRDIARAVAHGFSRHAIETAISGLRRRAPQYSAAGGLTVPQTIGVGTVAGALACGAVLAPWATFVAASAILAFIFAAVGASRLLACAMAMRGAAAAPRVIAPRRDDADLPVYTLLVPLYREAAVLPSLVAALKRLDYPAAKLDIRLILEADDAGTAAAAHGLDLPVQFHLVIVPPAEPRTKPKALNYALALARGELVAIYDAEDRPEPGQLRAAVEAFAAGPSDLACVQARLGFYNARETWLTRQFAIEYAGLFDALLPALDALGLPIPLGGTSNHFRRAALERAGAWDPHNVTEDADLGMRLARLGYSCRVIESHTWEEACGRPRPWLRQRSRWLKGWMQTWFVHMRAPARLYRELGPRGFAAFNLLIGGMVLAGLGHPVFLAAMAWQAAAGELFAGTGPGGRLLDTVNLFNLTVGYGAAVLLGWLGLRTAGLRGLSGALAWMPLYWVFISAAAWRALFQFVRSPYSWEKTEHGAARLIRLAANGTDRLG